MKNADKPINPYMYNGVTQREKTVDWDNDLLCGLTKREYFAAMAMQGLLSNTNVNPNIPDVNYIADLSVFASDSLLKQLDTK